MNTATPKATKLEFKEGAVLELTFQDGKIVSYDLADAVAWYKPYEMLKDRDLFLSGKLEAGFIVVWNDKLDLFVDTVYEEGTVVGQARPAPNPDLGSAFAFARAIKGISQTKLSQLTGVTQPDISKFEDGYANPTIETLKRLASALDASLEIKLIAPDYEMELLEDSDAGRLSSGEETYKALITTYPSEHALIKLRHRQS